jgi:trehalose 6-phosphate synthase
MAIDQPAPTRPVVVVSNRGPISFRVADDGTLQARRGAGGLVSGLGPLVAGTDATWIAAAMSEGDRQAAARGVIEAEGFRVRTLAFPPDTYRAAYDVVCNATLWFLHHGLWDLARRPRFDERWHEAWASYRAVNRAFADVVAEEAPDGAAVLVQDYHLCLLAPVLRDRRPDLRLVHFSHTPFAGPDLLRVLPDDVGAELLDGLAAHHACGFHTPRWARSWEASHHELRGGVPTAATFVSPLAPDPDDLAAAARSDACRDSLRLLDARVGDRSLLVRVDPMELSKNLPRGFHAFDDLPRRHPRWRGRDVFGAFCYPSREGLAEYLAYRQEVEGLVAAINERWGTDDWQPILLETTDDFPRSVAALRRFDVLLVNPIRDGLNLVAKEGALLNERDGLVALSPEAGAWFELEGSVRRVDPYDVVQTADALASALDATADERRVEAAELRRRARSRTPATWLADQLIAAG